MQFVQMPLSAVIYNDADDYYCDENDFQTFRKNICLPFYFSFNECSWSKHIKCLQIYAFLPNV